MAYPSDIVLIARRMNRQASMGKGIFIPADSFALLVSLGVNDLVQQKAGEFLKDQALRRVAAGNTIDGGATVSEGIVNGRAARTRAGQQPQSPDEAYHRLKEILRPGRR